MRLSEHLDGDGESIFQHACKMGLEGIVSKRRDFPYRSGRTKSWMKNKNSEFVCRAAHPGWELVAFRVEDRLLWFGPPGNDQVDHFSILPDARQKLPLPVLSKLR